MPLASDGCDGCNTCVLSANKKNPPRFLYLITLIYYKFDSGPKVYTEMKIEKRKKKREKNTKQPLPTYMYFSAAQA